MKIWIKRVSILFFAIALALIISFFIFIAPRRTTPILMYHSITSADQKNILTLPSYIFTRQMQYLSSRGFHVASLPELAQTIKEAKAIPRNWVVLTFDDGYADFYSRAYPILKNHGFKVTVFVTIDNLKKSGQGWPEIKQILKDGLADIGSHGLTHTLLPLLNSQQAKEEIFSSKSILEQRLNKSVAIFAYPYGALNDALKKMVQEAGYAAAAGIIYQRGEFKDNDLYLLKRIFVSKLSQYPFVFKFMLSGYYVPTREFLLKLFNIKVPRDFYSAKVKINTEEIR